MTEQNLTPEDEAAWGAAEPNEQPPPTNPLAPIFARHPVAGERMTQIEAEQIVQEIGIIMRRASLEVGTRLLAVRNRHGWTWTHRSWSAWLRANFPNNHARAYQLINYADRVLPALPTDGSVAYDDPRIPIERHVRGLIERGFTREQTTPLIREAILSGNPLAPPPDLRLPGAETEQGPVYRVDNPSTVVDNPGQPAQPQQVERHERRAVGSRTQRQRVTHDNVGAAYQLLVDIYPDTAPQAFAAHEHELVLAQIVEMMRILRDVEEALSPPRAVRSPRRGHTRRPGGPGNGAPAGPPEEAPEEPAADDWPPAEPPGEED